jgi:hypothetical protein
VCVSTRCHISCSFRPHLLADVVSGVTTCPTAPNLASLLSELRHCHVSLSSGSCLLKELSSGAAMRPRLGALPSWEGSSGAATCHMARDSTFVRGELQCCHVSHSPWRVVDHRNKEMLSYPRHAASLVCFQSTLMHDQSACKTCRSLQCGSIVQRRLSWSLLDMATEVIRPDRTALRYGTCLVQQSDKTWRLHAADAIEDIISYS